MTQDVDYGQLTGDVGAGPGPATAGDLRRLSAVPVDLSVEIGRARMTVGDTLELREGSVVTLDRMAGEPVDLLVNGTPIARGEVVVIDEQFGLRLTQVLSPGGTPEPVALDPELPAPDPVAAAEVPGEPQLDPAQAAA